MDFGWNCGTASTPDLDEVNIYGIYPQKRWKNISNPITFNFLWRCYSKTLCHGVIMGCGKKMQFAEFPAHSGCQRVEGR